MNSEAELEKLRYVINNNQFSIDQLMSLRTAIDNRIRVDIVSNVPYEIAAYIMSLLSPKDLCQAAQVCRSWRIVCEDNRLWREKCNEEGILDDKDTLDVLFKTRLIHSHKRHQKFAHEKSSIFNKSEWKAAYLKHMSILRNWTTRDFTISEPFITSTPVVVDQPVVKPIPEVAPIPHNRISRGPVTRRAAGLMINPPGQPRSQRTSGRINCNSRNDRNDCDINQAENSNKDGDQKASGYAGSMSFMKSYLMQLRCHEDCVITCLQYNARTNTIVSGSDDQTLKVWDSETGRCIATLEGHRGGVWSSQLSSDDIVISGSTDQHLNIWNAHSGKLLHSLSGHSSTVRCLALNGRKVVSGSRDKQLRLWDIDKGRCLHIFLGHTAAVRCLEFKDDIIVSGAYDHLVMVWNARTGARCHTLECHYSRIYSLQFDGKTIASGSLDSTICIWDAATGRLRHHLEGHTSLTSKMQLRGNLLVSANADSFCKVWDISTGKCLHTLGGEHKHTSAITSVYFNNRHVVTSSDDGTVKLWDLKTGNFIKDMVVLPTASRGGVVWRIRASYTKLICAVGSRTQTEDTHLLVLDFSE